MDGSNKVPMCEDEPIRIPGSIQPHGAMLVAARTGGIVLQAAGEVEDWLGLEAWQGAPLAALVGTELAARIACIDGPTYLGQMRSQHGDLLDVSAHPAAAIDTPDAADMLVIEFERADDQAPTAAALLDRLDTATQAFHRAPGLEALCAEAATAFRGLIGFDRVMIYRFLDDEAGRVLGEARAEHMRAFLNHHFPGSDIPAQARALYLRNLVRVIPDIHYTPAPLYPPAPGAPLDLSDSSLRSVSPVHLQYLFNMRIRASASFSIVKDGVLWGLVACHNETPRGIPYELRLAGRTLATALAREIKAKDEAEGYRQRLRLRSFEDDVVRVLSRDGSLDEALSNHVGEVQRLMAADGVAILRGTETITTGLCPAPAALAALTAWVVQQGGDMVRCTDRLGEVHPPADAYRQTASGLMAVVLSAAEPWVVLWFRAEQVQNVNWAGNPHENQKLGADETLTPRASFDLWVDTVHGQSRRWTLPEQESVNRLRAALLEVRQTRTMLELNHKLTALLRDKDQLLQQKEFLIGEVNHRVQNSLQLVGSFLAMQTRQAQDPALVAALEEARRRLVAVGLVHRRLYRGDQVESIDAARYIEDLCADAVDTMGADWRAHVTLDLAPVTISTDRAVTMGLVLTELMINVQKYAYGGQPGPLTIRLLDDRSRFQLRVEDHGVGKVGTREGFGTRMMDALVRQLGGELSYAANAPGLCAVLSAPAEASSAPRWG